MKSMSVKQFMVLLRHLNEKHHPLFSQGMKKVKYVIPSIDMRSGTVFRVELVGYGWREIFAADIDSKNHSGQLYSEVLRWLLTEQSTG